MSKSWLSTKIEVRTDDLGKERLFAIEELKKDQQITRRGDTQVLMMTTAEFDEFAKTTPDYDALAMAGGFKKVTLTDPHDPTGLAAKSNSPNAYNDGDGLLALRDITAGEEITVQ